MRPKLRPTKSKWGRPRFIVTLRHRPLGDFGFLFEATICANYHIAYLNLGSLLAVPSNPHRQRP